MKHTSVSLPEIEVLDLQPSEYSSLISKCTIKVCYVSDKPNRNTSVITKQVATDMAPSLRGAMIVGFYNEETEDFEQHNKELTIEDGKLFFKDTTKPYGFVDLNAKVWFQKFLDDNEVEREYLMTEGWLWTGQFPECQRVIDKGNNQSMELDEKKVKGNWTKLKNGQPGFFIINEAVVSKLCILGEDYEPCFEGATISNVQFSFEENFKNNLFSLMDEFKKLVEGGRKVEITTYAVEIGSSLWDAIYSYLEKKYPDCSCPWCSKYILFGIFEEGNQKFAILKDKKDTTLYRLDFSYDEQDGFKPSEELTEVAIGFADINAAQFSLEDIEAYAQKKNEQKEEEICPDCEKPISECTCKKNKEEDFACGDKKKKEYAKSKEDICPECGKPMEKCECEKKKEEDFACGGKKKKEDFACGDKKKKEYSLEEYETLESSYNELLEKYNELTNNYSLLENESNSLKEFKLSYDRKEKEEMINSFYMLSDEDKADVTTNIDSYSLEEIESKLSVICVRNKVNFNLDDDNRNSKGSTTYNLNSQADSESDMPAWVRAALENSRNKN